MCVGFNGPALRFSRRLAARSRVESRRGPGAAQPAGVVGRQGGAGGRLGAGAQLLVGGVGAEQQRPLRPGEPLAGLGEEVLLLPAVIAHPDDLRPSGGGVRHRGNLVSPDGEDGQPAPLGKEAQSLTAHIWADACAYRRGWDV